MICTDTVLHVSILLAFHSCDVICLSLCIPWRAAVIMYGCRRYWRHAQSGAAVYWNSGHGRRYNRCCRSEKISVLGARSVGRLAMHRTQQCFGYLLRVVDSSSVAGSGWVRRHRHVLKRECSGIGKTESSSQLRNTCSSFVMTAFDRLLIQKTCQHLCGKLQTNITSDCNECNTKLKYLLTIQLPYLKDIH